MSQVTYLSRRLAGQDNDELMLTATHNISDLYADHGKLDKAEEMYRRALAGLEKTLGSDHTSTLETVNNLGSLRPPRQARRGGGDVPASASRIPEGTRAQPHVDA